MSHDLEGETLSELKQQAIDWLVRLRDENISDDEIHAFADWLAEDYRHSEAFAAAEDLFDGMVLAARNVSFSGSQPVNEPKEGTNAINLKQASTTAIQPKLKNARLSAGNWLPAVLAIAAVWLFSVILVLPEDAHPLDRFLSDYHTATGELREVELTDGSRMLLNTNSAVSVNYDNTKRQIILHHGQVLFTVARNDNLRSFEVMADGLTVKALGTVFEVYRTDANEVVVSVQEHSVMANLLHNPEQQKKSSGVKVQAGERLRYRHKGILSAPESVELDEATAWQHKRLFFNDRPLKELIDELNRYRVGRVFISDTQVSQLRITGVFSLENPDDILRSVCRVLDLQETRLSEWWVLLHR